TTRHAGFLDGFGLTRSQCEDLILAARVMAGWIDEADLIAEEPEDETSGEETSEDGELAEASSDSGETAGEDASAS
ncbi:MAG: transcription termination/antitermination protein NusA, partial [Pseudomonadota bacterium]